ncbi:Hsp70 family protein [Nocardia sp. NPDC052566]|uniref:Hsp70 family protein n=1 Tax=Nocardia sp. NPDC052566 TaxID=3364330 RepID=UPI0037C76732
MNSVSASVTGERPRPSMRTRRTAVTFDSMGGARIGGIPQFTMAVTDFADLAKDPESVIVSGRLWSPTNLLAAVVHGMIETGDSAAGAAATYPAVYSDKQVSLLRQALDLSGAGHVMLVPEPVAAAEWLEHEHGPLETGFVLVYDLGGSSLDVTVVRVGPDWDLHPMVGKPMRSYDFGGRPLGAQIARYARGTGAASLTSIVDVDDLRTQHVRDSLELVRECVRSAGLTLSDISRILLVGGAARPPEVARTIAELGRPVLISADPGHSVAAGAAFLAARTMAPTGSGDRFRPPRVAVFSSAAAVSALAVSAMTVFGGPADPELTPVMERYPGAESAADALLYDARGDIVTDRTLRLPASELAQYFSGKPVYSAYSRFITPAASYTPLGPTLAESRDGGRGHNYDKCCSTTQYPGYTNPAQFTNPLPFLRPTPQSPAAAPAPGTGTGIGTPPSAPSAPQPNPAPAPGTLPAPGIPPAPELVTTPTTPDISTGAQPGSTGGTSTPAPGSTTPGTTSDGTSTSSPSTSESTTGTTTSESTSTGTTSTSTTNSGGTSSPGTTAGDTSATTSSGGTPGTSSSTSSGGESNTSSGTSAGTASSTSSGASSGASNSGTSSGASNSGASSGASSSGASSGASNSGASSSSSGNSSSSGSGTSSSSSGTSSSSSSSSSGGTSSGGASSGGASSGGARSK